MDIKFKILFNFYASDIGGGKKRLDDFSKFFNSNGGAFFIINENSSYLADLYFNNKYLIFKKNNFLRLINENWYIKNILKDFNLKYYFSYGIPVTKKLFDITILHISNVLPFTKISTNFKNDLLLKRLENSFAYTNFVSAESEFSLNLIQSTKPTIFLPNSCDEILSFKSRFLCKNYAVVVGTQPYKCVAQSISLFNEINQNKNLELIVIGGKFKTKNFKNSAWIHYLGDLERSEVLSIIASSNYYITSSIIENSHNSAMEGCYLSEKSFISDIPPHRELLSSFDTFTFNSIKYLVASTRNINKSQLKTNQEICNILLQHFNYLN